MEPDFGIGIRSKRAGGGAKRPRQPVPVRLLELLGLALAAYGLGTHRFGLAALGGAVIVGSYALYRQKHGPAQQTGSDSDPDGMDTDGGSD